MKQLEAILRAIRRRGSIRSQLILGFGLILILVVVIAITAYLNLFSIRTGITVSLEKAVRLRELSQELEDAFLLARESEASFLATWRAIGFEAAQAEHVTANQDYLKQARDKLNEIESLVRAAGDAALQEILVHTAEIRSPLDTYETAFLTTVGNIEKRSRPDGLESVMHRKLSDLEDAVTPLPNPTFLQLVLEIRANERAYLNGGQQQYVVTVLLLMERFKSLTLASAPSDLSVGATQLSAQDLADQAQSYLTSFSELVALEQDIDINTSIFRRVTSDINEHTSHINQVGQAGLSRARAQIQSSVNRSTIILTVTALLALGLGILIALGLARRIIRPLDQLSQAAQQMGRGHLEQPVTVSGGVELITLADAFNAMADQLRTLIGSLERRVAERTRGLQTAAEVSRATTALLDPDELLRQVVDLVRERYGLYYVGLFLLNQEARFAVLRAGTGEAGGQMLAQGHRLEAGGDSMIGQCVSRDEARIALDVGEEAVRFANPYLPETRSELALPLRARARVIGAMTVQSTQEAAFDEADIAVMQTMADQVAVAIDNARLFAEAQAALEEAEATHRRYLRQAWAEYLPTARTTSYETGAPGTPPLGDAVRAEIQAAVARRGTTVLGGDETDVDHSALVTPITLRGEIVGALGVHDSDKTRQWSADEIALVQAIAERMALAAENLRLIDETQRRATQDRLVSEVTGRVRQSLDLDTVLQTAAREMRTALGLYDITIRLESPNGHSDQD
jgi:GAF domain-containing protein/HAMP domain-containing protein